MGVVPRCPPAREPRRRRGRERRWALLARLGVPRAPSLGGLFHSRYHITRTKLFVYLDARGGPAFGACATPRSALPRPWGAGSPSCVAPEAGHNRRWPTDCASMSRPFKDSNEVPTPAHSTPSGRSPEPFVSSLSSLLSRRPRRQRGLDDRRGSSRSRRRSSWQSCSPDSSRNDGSPRCRRRVTEPRVDRA